MPPAAGAVGVGAGALVLCGTLLELRLARRIPPVALRLAPLALEHRLLAAHEHLGGRLDSAPGVLRVDLE